ncbi:39S ribosomal protein L4-like protein [Dinothrombium tinctorium]|uniref:Large ribosomal subunit protein uL4m n=1 Tax=Dinothrombium tinctorium TaxID=1965070 RepID=A0A3S4R6K2_9ACAR|nr:39S ribosomal protein L4-like protein [Dinothrombium tinctorium]RWS12227.1 39S ribosomal protein L4-like protein [Dinothrombium tinctorium]RWS15312.1 39S ribosomal protein L4-like protein [Dinothrombium tinctorium]
MNLTSKSVSRLFSSRLRLSALRSASERHSSSSTASTIGISQSTLEESKNVDSVLSVPTFFKRDLQNTELFNKNITPPREAWLENFDSLERRKLNVIELHPKVFGAFPRPDLIQLNHWWQTRYGQVDWLWFRTRAELAGSQKKPWQQKGTGRARHGSITAPQWIHGGWSHGPRGPRSHFFMLPFFTRVRGLIACLSAKFAQNDLKIVDTLEKFPSDDSKFLLEFVDKRGWGPSVLIVDKNDIFPRNIALASEDINHINLMPVYGLNVYSMLKHETLVLTLAAVEEIESKLLYQLTRNDLKEVINKFKAPYIGHQPKVF